MTTKRIDGSKRCRVLDLPTMGCFPFIGQGSFYMGSLPICMTDLSCVIWYCNFKGFFALLLRFTKTCHTLPIKKLPAKSCLNFDSSQDRALPFLLEGRSHQHGETFHHDSTDNDSTEQAKAIFDPRKLPLKQSRRFTRKLAHKKCPVRLTFSGNS